MSFLIDTNICSAYLKKDSRVWPKFLQYGGQLYASTITVGELYSWVLRKRASPKQLIGLQSFLSDIIILDVTAKVAEKFGALRAERLDAGQRTPDMDLIIAATALVYDLTIVTHNTHDFVNIPGVKLQDWLSP